MKLGQQIITIVLLLVLLLSILNPFSALSALMLITVGMMLYWLLIALVRAFVSAEVQDLKKE